MTLLKNQILQPTTQLLTTIFMKGKRPVIEGTV